MAAENKLDPDAAWLGDDPGQKIRDPLTTALDALYLAGPGPAAIEQALNKTRAALQAGYQPDIFYDTIPETPIGPVFLALTSRGLLAVDMNVSEADFLETVWEKTRARPEPAPERFSEPRRQITAYLNGERQDFDLTLDLGALTPFQRQVLLTTARVPRGKVATYGEIARRIGKPQASRAVGQALGQNPVPIVIPCHRVVASDGTLGGYSGGGGLETKKQLLTIEGVPGY